VLPRLVLAGRKATFFIVSGFCARDAATRVVQGRRRYLVWPEVRALKDAGMEIGSHTVSHRRAHRPAERRPRCRDRAERSALQAYLGQGIDFFAYPYNDQTQWVRTSLQRSATAARWSARAGNTIRSRCSA